MTVLELYENLGKLIQQGKGNLQVLGQHTTDDAMVTSMVTGAAESFAYTSIEYVGYRTEEPIKIKQHDHVCLLDSEDIDWLWN